MKKKRFAGLAVFTALAMAVTGCSSAKTETKTEDTEKIEAEEAGTKTVTDLLGREVEVPTQVDSIIAVGAGGLRMICYAGAEDLVVGVEEGEHEQTLAKCYNYVNYDTFKDLPVVGTGGSGSYEAYEEEMLNLSPDVIFAAYPQDLADDLQNKTGIPVVVITYDLGMFDEKLYESMELIGNILGKEERCDEVVAALKGWESDISSRTEGITEKPTVYMGACSFKGGHGIEGTYVKYPPFTALGVEGVQDSLSDKVGGVNVDLEQITVWDPEFIFLDPNNMSLVNDDYAVNPDYYESLSAVQNGKVYTQVAYNWYTTNVETAVADSYYAGIVLFPEAFADISMDEIAPEIYTTMLGAEAEGYYEALVAGGLGWQQLKLGE